VVQRAAAELDIIATLHTTPHDLEGASAVASQILSGPRPPTAFFCLADSMAYGVYAASRELGLRVPQDVSVLGFDDYPVSALLTPPLSSYRWPIELLVDSVVERTVKAIDEGKHSRRKVLIPTAYPRGSVASPTT
jgi:LacI family transcriptional regulator